MGKITKYMMVMIGLVLLFHFTGLLTQCDEDGLCKTKTPNSALLAFVLDVESIRTSEVYNQVILAIQAIAIVGGVLAGFAINRVELAAIITFTLFAMNLLIDFVYIFVITSQNLNPVFAILLIGPMLAVFVMSMLEWFRGIST